MWSICRMAFFFTTPNSTKMPSSENMSMAKPKMTTLAMANGKVSGNDIKMVIGCSHDSNCAARIKYMNTIDMSRPSAKLLPVCAMSFVAPTPVKWKLGGRFCSSTASRMASWIFDSSTPGAALAMSVIWRSRM